MQGSEPLMYFLIYNYDKINMKQWVPNRMLDYILKLSNYNTYHDPSIPECWNVQTSDATSQ